MLPEGISLLNEKWISHVVKILVVTGCASYLEPSFNKSNASENVPKISIYFHSYVANWSKELDLSVGLMAKINK